LKECTSSQPTFLRRHVQDHIIHTGRKCKLFVRANLAVRRRGNTLSTFGRCLHLEKEEKAYRILTGKPEERRPLGERIILKWIIMVHIFNRLHNNLFNYTTCFDPNKSFSSVFSYPSFTIELQHEIRIFLRKYIGHKRLRSFLYTVYLGIST
jgi:hypothetical protein